MAKNNLTYHIKLLHTFNLLYKNEMIEAENIFVHLNLIIFNDKKNEYNIMELSLYSLIKIKIDNIIN